MKEYCEAFNFPRSFLKDHNNKTINGRKMESIVMFTKEENVKLVNYMKEMVT